MSCLECPLVWEGLVSIESCQPWLCHWETWKAWWVWQLFSSVVETATQVCWSFLFHWRCCGTSWLKKTSRLSLNHLCPVGALFGVWTPCSAGVFQYGLDEGLTGCQFNWVELILRLCCKKLRACVGLGLKLESWKVQKSHSKHISTPLLLPPKRIWILKSSYSPKSPIHVRALSA